MLGGAREFRYDWILLRARDLPHEANDPQLSCSRGMRHGGSRWNIARHRCRFGKKNGRQFGDFEVGSGEDPAPENKLEETH